MSVLTSTIEFIFTLNLTINLNRCSHGEHDFQCADVFAMPGRVYGKQLIAYYHRVHVVLFCKEVK